MKNVNIMGISYKINYTDTTEKLGNLEGLCDFFEREITIRESNNKSRQNIILRHEIVHAFLYESGLDICSWGRNEEIVDWIALQLPKMLKICKEIL